MKSKTRKKDKFVAILLALFAGWVGVHRFYLGQKKLGFLYLVLMFTGFTTILAIIDIIYFSTMSKKKFDLKYNGGLSESSAIKNRRGKHKHRGGRRARRKELEALTKKGKEQFKDFLIEEAAETFTRALELSPKNAALHFNLACSYSILERTRKVYEHIEAAVENGFDDYSRLLEHDSLAFIRLDENWSAFVKNGFRKEPVSSDSKNFKLIQELKRITDLKDRGIIDELEYKNNKVKLLNG